MRILIKNATIVNEGRRFKGCLSIADEYITQVAEGIDSIPSVSFDEVIDAEGLLLLPGIIDTHVHFREPGLTHKATFATESQAAAAGGVTTVFDMPNTLPQTTTLQAWNEKRAIAYEHCIVNYSIFFGATSDNIDQLPHLDATKTPGIKLFMGSSTGNMLVDGNATLNRIFASAELPIVTHCEDTNIINANMQAAKAKFGDDPEITQHPKIRSEEACYQSTKLAVDLAQKHQKRLHVAHLTTARELSLFNACNPLISAEVCVPHLFFTDADYNIWGARIKCNPAIKSKSDRDALRNALNTGKIYSIATDHAPHLLEEKQGGAAKAMSGMPMLQFSLVSMLDLADEGIISIERIVELMAHNPARLFNIEKRGFLAKGYKADMVLIKPEEWTLCKENILSKCGWSPFEGKSFKWKVCETFVNGNIAYREGKINTSQRGEELTFVR